MICMQLEEYRKAEGEDERKVLIAGKQRRKQGKKTSKMSVPPPQYPGEIGPLR